jgi:predicted ATPase/DNA-binding winged helix-turn-helix (wHTH) protein
MSTGPKTSAAREFTFGPFYLYATERRLLRDGQAVDIGSRALDILIALVEQAGEVIGKKALVARVWPDVIVEESSLRVHVAALRKALGDGLDGARYIANVPGRGYSFVAPVTQPTSASPPSNIGAAPSATTPERSQARLASTLPARLTRMIGRDAAVAALSEQLRECRFVTIVGPGGLGKTTVAVSVAHLLSTEFGSAVFVDLAAVTDAAGVANGLASTLGLTVRKEDPTQEILAFLRDASVLLVLDNCEHVIESIGALAERIFIEAPRVHILATSRELLNVEGEHVFALDPLETPAAEVITAARALEYASVQLFLERAGATSGSISLSDEDALVVAEICRRLDGIALAVELAAGRVSVFGIRGTAELLEKQLALLWRGRRTAVPRHQTLNATLDWSYTLLSQDEKVVLQRLSIFVGDFKLAGALAIMDEGDDSSSEAIEIVASLVAKSLVAMRITDGQPRYRLLEMVRAYAAQKLAESGDAELIAARHAKYFAQRCREAETPGSAAVETRDLGNIRSALEWSFSERGDAGIARDLSIAATPLLLRWSLLAECRGWSSRALERLQESDRGSIHESRLLRTCVISSMFTLGNQLSLRVQIGRGLELARDLGDRRGQFEFLTGLHAYGARTGDFHGAVMAAAEAADVASDAELASAQWMLSMGHHLSGDQLRALASSEQGMLNDQASPPTRKRYFGYDQRTPGLAVRARVLWLMGQTQSALETATQAVDEGAALKHPVSYCLTLLYATSVYLWSGRWTDAEQAIERLVDTSRNYSLEPYFAGGQALKGELLHGRGAHEAAIPLLTEATQRLNKERQIAQAPYCATILADTLRCTGRLGAALEVLDHAIEQRRSGGGSFEMPEMLRIKAQILLGSSPDNRAKARDCLKSAAELAQTQGALSWELRVALALTEQEAGTGTGQIAELVARFPRGAESRDLDRARQLIAD